MDVEFFSEVRNGRSFAFAGEATPDAVTLGDDSGIRPMSAAAGGTHYLVFVDDFFSIGAQRGVAIASLRRDLALLGPQDRMAVVSFDGARLTVLSGWSASAPELAAALDRARARPAYGPDRAVQLGSFIGEEQLRAQAVSDGFRVDTAIPKSGALESGALGGPVGDFHLNGPEVAFAELLKRQVSAGADAASGAMRAFADAPGRKVLLLLCGGWPYSAHAYAIRGTGRPVYELPEGERVLRPLADTANLLGYTIYPVDLPGLQPSSGADVEMTAVSPLGSPLFTELEIEQSLLYLARETGGRPLLDGKRETALASANEDTRTFYWLGLVPGWRGDDRPHRLGVEVRRPDLRVRARSGFLDLSRQAETSMRLESALLLGSFASDLPMTVEVGAPRKVRRGQVELPLVLELPVDLLTMVPMNGGYGARLELRFVATDERGAASQMPVVAIELVTDEPPAPGKLVRHEMTVKLRGRADHLVVAAYDPATDRMATAEADLSLK